jgi:phage repressor protein C with HTH and peptisase S24 domain
VKSATNRKPSTSEGWATGNLQGVTDKDAYALEITGDSMQPVYREGDTIIISPTATIHKGDRVVVRTMDGQVMAKVLHKKSARKIELASFNPDLPVKSLDAKNLDWMARIIWASQ